MVYPGLGALEGGGRGYDRLLAALSADYVKADGQPVGGEARGDAGGRVPDSVYRIGEGMESEVAVGVDGPARYLLREPVDGYGRQRQRRG